MLTPCRSLTSRASFSYGGNHKDISTLQCSKRFFFPFPGADTFTPPTPKVVSPLAPLRPPAPPSAGDARPFGSLNRSNRAINYVNVNAQVAKTNTVAAAAAAGGGGRNDGDAKALVNSIDATTSAASSSFRSPPLPAAAAPMDLSRLLARRSGVGVSVGNSSGAATTSPTTATSGALRATQSPAVAAAASPESITVAKAEAVIAARNAQAVPREAATSSSQHNSNTRAGKDSGKSNSAGTHATGHQQVYREHCTVGWSLAEFFDVVADVAQYKNFLPWCLASTVHSTRPIKLDSNAHHITTTITTTTKGNNNDGNSSSAPAAAAGTTTTTIEAAEMTATLLVGIFLLSEEYTSQVTLIPGQKIIAELYDPDAGDGEVPAAGKDESASDGGGGVLSLLRRAAHSATSAARKSVLNNLRCEWDFAEVPGKPNEVEVTFAVSFEFKNPMHSKLLMSNIVPVMTRSFERRCEALYGPPSAMKQALPLTTA